MSVDMPSIPKLNLRFSCLIIIEISPSVVRNKKAENAVRLPLLGRYSVKFLFGHGNVFLISLATLAK